MYLAISVRADVLDAITHELRGTEALSGVIEDLAYWEAAARKRFAGSSTDTGSPVDCTMTEPQTQVAVCVPNRPIEMLRESMQPGETLDGLVTALLITEVRHRRTWLHWPVFCADEPIMTDDATSSTTSSITTTPALRRPQEVTSCTRSPQMSAPTFSTSSTRPWRHGRIAARSWQRSSISKMRSATRAYYDRKRAQGKKHNQALIALARRRCNVLFAMLRDGAYFHTPMEVAAA